MKFEKSLLAAREPTNVYRVPHVYPHPFERGAMGDRRNDEPPIIFGTDKATVKEVINAGRQEQPEF